MKNIKHLLGLLLLFGVTNFVLLSKAYAIELRPSAEPLYFHPLVFAKCIQESFDSYFVGNDLDIKLATVSQRREAFVESKGGTFYNKAIIRRLRLHSIPLIESAFLNRVWSSKIFTPEESKVDWYKRTSLLFVLAEYINSETAKSVTKMSSDELFKFISAKYQINKASALRYSINQFSNFNDMDKSSRVISIIANPVVEWLLKQKNHSVTHIQLYRQALRLYDGDPLTALGVIGHIFDDERMYYGQLGRKKFAVLSNKLIPILPRVNEDTVGYNYHFWSYLNLAVQGGSWKEQAFNYTFQWLKQSDIGDYSANYWGLVVGNQIFEDNLSNIKCPL